MARKSNRRAAAAAPVAEIESTDKGGMNIDDGIVLFTALVLVLALVCVVMAGNIYK